MDGQPVAGVVAGDVSIDGRLITCVNCHRPSGLGSEEGSVITWPINGKELLQPRRRTGAWRPPGPETRGPVERHLLPPQYQVPDVRPAYDDGSLARALREGLDPAAQPLNPAMPRYQLTDENMAVLVHYLKRLSVVPDPGVNETTLRFATVVSEDLRPEDRAAMLDVIMAHVDAHNAGTRHERRRATSGPFYKTEKYEAYRQFELDVWELRGPRESWQGQLAAYNAEKPVFALLGGMVTGSWAPIHEFCEENKIPSIFPITDLPVVSDDAWYTLYFSKGLYQEGEAAAGYLRTHEVAPGTRVVQLYRAGDETGEAAARGFDDARARSGMAPAEHRPLREGERLTTELWRDLLAPAGTKEETVVLLWSGMADLAATGAAGVVTDRPEMIIASATLLGDDLSAIAEGQRGHLYLTFPQILPAEKEARSRVLERWLKIREIAPADFGIQAKMYFLGWMLPGAIAHMRSEFFRDYFLEGFEMMEDQNYAIAVYPRLSFGPDQRYASKGTYVVQLGPGDNPELLPRSGWITY